MRGAHSLLFVAGLTTTEVHHISSVIRDLIRSELSCSCRWRVSDGQTQTKDVEDKDDALRIVVRRTSR